LDFKKELKQRSDYIEILLKEYMPKEEGYQKRVIEAMNYSLSAGGKRLRPILTLEACKAICKNDKDARAFAVAIEMIHTYSLIHDDLPSLDNDDLRRGKPTNHKVFGEAMAILAGDSLLNYAFEIMLSNSIGKENPNKYLCAIYEIAKSSGIYGMIGGQVVDVESENTLIEKDKLDFIHLNKTAAIMVGCMRAGAIIAGANETQLKNITTYAKNIGLAFQIVDDILDIVGDETKLGKNVGSDIQNNKSTYPSLLGIEKSKIIAKNLIDEAKLSINELDYDTEFLNALADYIISREY
jgi:geranylgeranyl diphosphate synthase type II